jgi:GTPase
MHSGYVALVGRPNVGKSTLMNAILGEKVSIVSPRPQTTRNRISGIFTSDTGQIVFVDTPGIHAGRTELNQYMVKTALASLADVDVVAVIVEAHVPIGPTDREILEKVFSGGRPVILLINKVDRVKPNVLLPLIQEYSELGKFEAIIPISALQSEGTGLFVETVHKLLPEHPLFFPADQLTEVPERFIAAEIIREKAFELLEEELPYAVAVEIENFDESDPAILRLAAVINVERAGQKGIVIGKGGAMLKQIGTRARLDLEKFFATKVFLEIFVRVTPNWSRKPAELKRLGYD